MDFRKDSNSGVRAVKAWRERSEKPACPVEFRSADYRKCTQQNEPAVIQKFTDQTMKHDAPSNWTTLYHELPDFTIQIALTAGFVGPAES